MRCLGAALVLLALAGCATAPPRLPENTTDPVALCRAQIARVDAVVSQAGTGDAGADRIEGFPWLRVTRPLASFRDEIDTPARFDAWLARLTTAATTARRHELANLPPPARRRLAEAWAGRADDAGLPTALRPGLAACRARLNRPLVAEPQARRRLRNAAVAEDEYRTWERVLGVYPLARVFARPRIVSYQQERAAAFDQPADARVQRYAVTGEQSGHAAATARGIARDALDIPQPTAAEAARLFAAHAPVWALATQSAADRPGALRLQRAGPPAADPERPAEYRRLSWTRFHGDVLLQLNYMIWFPERPAQGSVDLYSGHLDGLIWRVTLAPDGRVLAYDSIHPCGCFYTLFPGPGWRVADMPWGAEPVASPRRAPATAANERLVVQLESGTHYLAGLATTARPAEATPLAPLPFGQLRSLPRPDGGHASAFAPDGLIPSSARAERFLFWPFGVPSAGAMRQWGTHAIAFVDRRHFDDPRLLERLLEVRVTP